MGKNDKVMSEIFSVAGKYILEGGDIPRMTGDAEQITAIRRATLASRRLYEALCSENATLDTVTTMMEEKRKAAAQFKMILGRDWRF